jgi:HD-like signal output (HDOD) protein
MDKSDQYIDRVSHLPPAPTVATELLGLFGDANRDLDRIVELISHDPSLTAEVLKRCNSAALSGPEPASDMFEVVTRLGFYEVYRVVAALVGSRSMSLGKDKGSLDVGSLWRHSVVAGVVAETLARRV